MQAVDFSAKLLPESFLYKHIVHVCTQHQNKLYNTLYAS